MNHQAYELIINALGGPDAVGEVSTALLKHEELRHCFKEAVFRLAERLRDDDMAAFNRLVWVVENHATVSLDAVANNIGKACVAMKVKPPLIF